MARHVVEAGRLVAYGATTAVLYMMLFFFEERILQLTGQGGWSFVIPMAIAFALSYTHGVFTASFWDFLGVKARS